MKNIVICCDGTGNQLDEKYSNVVKFYSALEKSPGKQVTYYDAGVGTIPHDHVPLEIVQKIKKGLALALGIGLEENVTEAYSYLMNIYEAGDQIYLFGFSRGAYTVRVLAGLISQMGLLEKGCQHLIPYAWQYYRECYKPAIAKLSGEFKSMFTRSVDVHFLGAWDTVSSVGLLGGYKSYPNTKVNENILNVRHAIAIDERRRFYRQNLFERIKDNNNIKQVWFAGVHSDVGGSYPFNESGLSQISLAWMIREAGNKGLFFDQARVASVLPTSTANVEIAAPDPYAPIHQSLSGGWWIFELWPKRNRETKKWRPPFGAWRTMFLDSGNKPVRPIIHCSVVQRMRNGYAPHNLKGRKQSDYDIEY